MSHKKPGFGFQMAGDLDEKPVSSSDHTTTPPERPPVIHHSDPIVTPPVINRGTPITPPPVFKPRAPITPPPVVRPSAPIVPPTPTASSTTTGRLKIASNLLSAEDRLRKEDSTLSRTSEPSLRSGSLRPTAAVGRPVILKTNIITKQVKNNNGVGMKELVRDIRLEVREGSLVAMLGTAGAGKSTVMNCMNGMELQGVKGSVLYRNVDLVHNFEQMKHLIGSVPQDKVFHDAFTPEQEFMLAAKLRLPAETTDREIQARVNKTLEMLSMSHKRKTRNSKLSGGEKTRVNIGIELVADRDLLCLDEPDQGLSPNYKHEVFEILQNLAHTHGKTVISIIHDVSEIDMFDQVIMLAKVGDVGRLAFSGSPAEARDYFGVEIRDAYALLEREPERFIK